MFGMHGGMWVMLLAYILYVIVPIAILIGALYLIFVRRKPPK